MKVGVLLLAAGRSRRFGSDKRIAPFEDGRTLLQATVASIEESGLECLVCLGIDDDILATRHDARGITWARCPDAGKGMGHTLSDGMKYRPRDWQGILVALADMPWVKPDSYRQIARRLTQDTIVVPQCDGRAGNPVGFGSRFFCSLEKRQGDHGAKDLIAQHAAAVHSLALDDPGIHRDVDSPDALIDRRNDHRG